MSAPLLLAWIAGALLLQLAIGIGIALWRRARAAPSMQSVASRTLSAAANTGQPWRDFRVVRRAFEDQARSQCSFYLEPADGLALPSYQPGQFVTFQLQVPNGDSERTIVRCYSLSDKPDPAHYRVTIKRVLAPAGRPELPAGVSSSYFHEQVQIGSTLRLKPPSGHFTINPDPSIRTVLIAGGIGITPMMSMLRWCIAEQPRRVVHLYYGVRDATEIAFRSQLEEWARTQPNFHLNLVFSRPAPGGVTSHDYLHTGHVDIDLLRRTLPHGRHQFYVCGPARMMESLVPALIDWGVPRQDLHFESFGPASVTLGDMPSSPQHAAEAARFDVHFARSGRTVTWEGQESSLLEFADRHGVTVDSGCRAGSCGSCETRVLSGEVQYGRTPDHDVAPGHCLLCVGAPASSLVLDA